MAKKEKQKGSGLFGNLFNRVKEKVKQVFAPKKDKPKQPTEAKRHAKPQQIHEDKPKQVTAQTTQQPPKPKEPKPIQQIKKDIQQKREEYTPTEPQQPHVENTSNDTTLFATITIEHYRAELGYYPNSAKPKLSAWLDNLIETNGAEAVAEMIQDATASGVELTSKIAYDDELLSGYVADMLNYLPDITDWYKAEILDEFETWTDLY